MSRRMQRLARAIDWLTAKRPREGGLYSRLLNSLLIAYGEAARAHRLVTSTLPLRPPTYILHGPTA